MRDAAWYMERLEQRLFNRDSEGMLVERLSKAHVRLAVWAVMNPPECLVEVTDVMDAWLDDEFVLPTGHFCRPLSLDEFSPELRANAQRAGERRTQAIQLRNSYGMGVFVGGLLAVLAETSAEVGVEIEVSLKPALAVLGSSSLLPDDLEDSGERPWAERMQWHLSDLARRVPLMGALKPIVRRHGFMDSRHTLLTSRRMMYAQRSMFLAGLMSAGLDPKTLFLEVVSSPGPRKRRDEQASRESRVDLMSSLDLFRRTDEELESLVCEELESLMGAEARMICWKEVVEELEFRLRNNRLSRMLAHLKRISRDEREREDTVDEE